MTKLVSVILSSRDRTHNDLMGLGSLGEKSGARMLPPTIKYRRKMQLRAHRSLAVKAPSKAFKKKTKYLA